MGSGKTTVGTALSNSLSLPFFDLDEYIERNENMAIEKIFSKYGEEYFREIEHKYLCDLLCKDEAVISLGGGTLTQEKNRQLIHSANAFSVFLDITLDTAKKRTENTQRPMLEKYDIENLFEGLPYAIFDPELFALYAATDAYKSFVLSQWQKKQLELPENQRIKELYYKIEQPLHTVVADMEWRGIEIDKDFASRLSKRYHDDLTKTQAHIESELSKLNDTILAWRSTPEANVRYFKDAWLKKNTDFAVSHYATQVGDKWRLNSIENMPFKIDEACSKSLNQQLSDPVVLTSPTQVAILLYDVLNVGVIDNKISVVLKNINSSEVFCVISNKKPDIDDKNWVKCDNNICLLDYNSNYHNIYIKYEDKAIARGIVTSLH